MKPAAPENLRDLLIRVFSEFRRAIPSLRINDLRDALRLLDDGWEYDALSDGEGIRSLQSGIRLLWCRRPQKDHPLFDRIWARHSATIESPKKDGRLQVESSPDQTVNPPAAAPEEAPAHAAAGGQGSEPRPAIVSALPLKTPSQLSAHAGPMQIGSVWPLTPRAMAYGWQRLRRPRHDGPAAIFDLNETIKQVTREGDLIEPAFAREARNHTHLIMLIDRLGSMAPFHPFTRTLFDSAKDAQRAGIFERVDVFYFHNIVSSHLYSDGHLSKLVMTREASPRPARIAEALPEPGRDRCLLIVSDAGATSDRIEGQMDRISATLEMVTVLSRLVPSIVWLNPMPQHRWKRTAAETIAEIVDQRMFDISKEGFRNAIRALQRF